jgi:hypothetical protein
MIRSMLRWPSLCLWGFAATVLVTSAIADPPQQLTPAQMREDLSYLQDTWARQDRSFSPAARDEFDREVRALGKHVATLTVPQFELEVARLVAIGGNGHTTAHIPPMDVLPIRLWWFDDGLYVVSAEARHAASSARRSCGSAR